MAITLAQLAKIETDPLRKYVLMNIIRDAPLMELLPFTNIDSLEVKAVRWQTLPAVAFRSINEGYTASEGDTEQIWESLYGFGGEISYDRVFEKIKNVVVDPKKLNTDMKIKSMAFTFNDYLINGDHATDPKGFEGLKKRVAAMPARQSVYFAASNAAALDPTAAVANARAFFDKVEEVYYKVKGNAQAMLMNEGMYYGIGRALRYAAVSGGSLLDVTTDTFGREVLTFRSARFVDVGLKKDQATEIIVDTEVAGDSGTDATSIYGVRLDEQEGVIGIQLSPMEVYDPNNGGESESTPTKKVRIDWWMGLASLSSHGITRGRNVEGASNWT